ncbi:MAG: peptide chain release factor aRF-1, partial [Methanopyri archaeon]|nr:peptide chain release factor aRF-1 [Methanopyri archaeon]
MRFRAVLNKLKGMHGRGTELVTVYIPPGYEIAKISNELKQEQGTATNIKSKTTRKNVVSALERIVQHLRLHPRPPEHGMAVFCGNVSEREGQQDIQLFPVIPPFPITNKLYRCSQRFILEPLFEMLQFMDTYGLLVLDRGGATIAFLKGKRIDIIRDVKSMVPGKFRAGGQSAARFERAREGLAKDFYKRVGVAANEVFANIGDIKGIIVGGPGPTKEGWMDGDFLRTEIRAKVLAVKDTSYTGDFGIKELVERSEDVLAEAEVTHEKHLMHRFLERLGTGQPVTYGEAEVRRALEAKAVEIVLFSEKLQWNRVTVECGLCKFNYKGTVKD